MTAPKPVGLTIEYEDGTKKSFPIGDLSLAVQAELFRQPVISRPSPAPEKENFLLLEWTDGWKEIFEVDGDCQEINRYYVISRQEAMGRLSLKKLDGYPELIEINRKPLDLKKIHFLDTFNLNPHKSVREGEKTDHFFSLHKTKNTLSDILLLFKGILKQEGLESGDFKGPPSVQKDQAYQKVSQKMGIWAGQRQQDVFDFIAFLAGVAEKKSSIKNLFKKE